MSNKKDKYSIDFDLGEEGMIYGKGSKDIIDFETNILSKLLQQIVRNQSLKGLNISNPSLSLGFEGGNIHPSLKNWYGTLGTNVYPTNPQYRTNFEWGLIEDGMEDDALMDLLLTIGYRF